MQQYRIHKDDKVMIMAGKDKGATGKILKVYRKSDRVLVEKRNMVKRHTKPNPYQQQPGGIIEKEMPIHISNVMVICSSCNAPVRIGYRHSDDGTKIRFCKKCNQTIE